MYKVYGTAFFNTSENLEEVRTALAKEGFDIGFIDKLNVSIIKEIPSDSNNGEEQ